MKIATLYARFYKSLNFDYVSKDGESPIPDWDTVPDGRPFPHVQVSLQPDITTVVGSNESGKTQVIDAIRLAITGEGIARRDFCRYSEFFAVDAPVSFPEFGVGLAGDDAGAVSLVNGLLELEGEERIDTLDGVRLFRRAVDGSTDGGVVYWGSGSEASSKRFDSLDGWSPLLPEVWEIDANIALPDSVPIDWLLDPRPDNAMSRSVRIETINSLLDLRPLLVSEESVKQNASQIAAAVSRKKKVDAESLGQLSVATDLIFSVAGVDRSNIVELREAIADGEEGYVATIIDSINERIDRQLAPSSWWTQDSEFRVLVSARDHDLVLTIRDRTGKDYTFDERSRGLKYFLSYLVQFMAERPRSGASAKILLMDEPDAFLSGQGQQDLLKILATAADPEDPEYEPCQVVYVTHSPFLIDRNHPERVRVLEKGDLDEGTRVVAAAHHNRFEPVRTALGHQVGESAFVGAENIIVEGVSDQILLAGLNTWLRRHGIDGRPIPQPELLDLNRVVLVQAGGTPHIPYMALLARGRGEVKPPVVVLLDSDDAGDTAVAELSTLASSGSPIVRDEFVLRLGDHACRAAGLRTIEDLVPWAAAREAMLRFLADIGHEAVSLPVEPPADLQGSPYAHLSGLLEGQGASALCGKVAFARAVVDSLPTLERSSRSQLEASFAELLSRVSVASEQAASVERAGQIRRRLARAIRSFKRERTSASQRQWAALLLDDLDALLDDGPSYEPLRQRVRDLRHEFSLAEDLGEPFVEHDDFAGRLDPLLNLLRIEEMG
jgi:hypothetical protein